MDTQKRIRLIRIIDKMDRNSELCKKMGTRYVIKKEIGVRKA